jgi:hypothetical protein
VLGVEGTGILVGGGQCSVGVYLTDDTGDFGLATSLGGGGGWDVSAEGFVSVQSTESLTGPSLNVSASPGALFIAGGSVNLDPETQQVTGGSFSLGGSPLPNGGSITRTNGYALSIPKAPGMFKRTMTAIGQKARNYLYPPCGM